jgi:hypothetical protein
MTRELSPPLKAERYRHQPGDAEVAERFVFERWRGSSPKEFLKSSSRCTLASRPTFLSTARCPSATCDQPAPASNASDDERRGTSSVTRASLPLVRRLAVTKAHHVPSIVEPSTYTDIGADPTGPPVMLVTARSCHQDRNAGLKAAQEVPEKCLKALRADRAPAAAVHRARRVRGGNHRSRPEHAARERVRAALSNRLAGTVRLVMIEALACGRRSLAASRIRPGSEPWGHCE